MAGVFGYFRSDKAARELGHAPREGRATLRDTRPLAREPDRTSSAPVFRPRMAGVFGSFRSDKAARELGHAPREGRATLRDTVRWLENRT